MASARLGALAVVLVLFGSARGTAAPILIESAGGGYDAASGLGEWHTGVDDLHGPMGTVAILTGLTPRWAAPVGTSRWVSFVTDGEPSLPGQTATRSDDPAQAIANGEWVTFRHGFWLPSSAAAYSGALQVLADDTATVTLNGTTLAVAAGPFGLGGNMFGTCSDTTIGCLPATLGTLQSIGQLVKPGYNLLQFQVFQRHGANFGLSYSLSLDAQPVPEPGTLLLLGSGLLGAAAARRRVARTRGRAAVEDPSRDARRAGRR